MDLRALTHLAKTVGVMTLQERVVVLGSASLLATYRELGEVGNLLEPTFDADFLMEGEDDGTMKWLYKAIGEDSTFRRRFGYYADFLRSGIRDLLSPGWEDRLLPLADCPGVVCLEPHDLAVAKLRAGRPKDLALLTALLATNRRKAEVVRARLDAMDRMPSAAIVATYRRLAEITAGAVLPSIPGHSGQPL